MQCLRLLLGLMLCVAISARANEATSLCPGVAQRAALATAANRDGDTPETVQRQRWESLLAAHRACSDADAEATALAAWTDHSMRRQARDDALSSETARYALAARVNLKWQRADAALRLGKLLTERGEMDLAERRLRESSALFEELQAWSEAADAQSRLSRFNRLAGDYLAALTDEQAALVMRRHIDPPPNVWRSLLNLAVLYEQLELADDARRRYAEALDEAEREGNELNVAIVLSDFAGFLNDFGAVDAPQALAMAERALAIVQPAGDLVQIAGAHMQIGRAQMNLDHLDQAERAFATALPLAVTADHRAMQAHVQFRYGELALRQHKPQLALQRVDAARLIYEAQGNRHRLVKVHTLLESIYEQLGDGLNAARSGRERFRLRDDLIGSKATGKLGELLSRFELTEERRRSERLAEEKAVAELRLVAERRQLLSIYLVVAAIAIALLLLGWRYVTARRLNRLLSERNALVQAQAEQLELANRQLTDQSERLYRSSITDALTGTHNRAHGMHRLHQLLVELQASNRQPCVLLIDVDHFKAINDTHGHPVGDRVLVHIAAALQQNLPQGAVLSRVGGEEFMVLLDDASIDTALALGNRLRIAVREATSELGARAGGVTISVGITSCRSLPECTPQHAYSAADEALYQAKHDGRDRVCTHAGVRQSARPH